jgi:hypothetical protein
MAKRATAEFGKWCREILETPEYRTRIKREADLGILDRNIELALWHYAYGKPIERIELEVTDNLRSMSDEELEALEKELREEAIH